MSETLPLAAEDGAILYLPQGAVARAQYIDKLAQTDPTDDAKLTVVVGGVAYNTTWGALKAANLEAVPQLAMEAIAGDVQAVETARQQVEANAGAAGMSEDIALGAADMSREERMAAERAKGDSEAARDITVKGAAEAAANAERATIAANSAAAAATAATVAANLFPDVPAGLAASPLGQTFNVAGAGEIYATTYRNVAGSAVYVQSYPSKAALDAVPARRRATVVPGLLTAFTSVNSAGREYLIGGIDDRGRRFFAAGQAWTYQPDGSTRWSRLRGSGYLELREDGVVSDAIRLGLKLGALRMEPTVKVGGLETSHAHLIGRRSIMRYGPTHFAAGGLWVERLANGGWTLSSPKGALISVSAVGQVTYHGAPPSPVRAGAMPGVDVVFMGNNGRFVGASWDSTGALRKAGYAVPASGGGGGFNTGAFNAVEAAAMQDEASTYSERSRRRSVALHQPVEGVVYHGIYGQSLSSGWEGWPVRTRFATYSTLLMMGLSINPASESAAVWDPVGGDDAFRPLVGTVSKNASSVMTDAEVAALTVGDGNRGETPLNSAATALYGAWLRRRGRPAAGDPDNLWVVASTGVGGKTIAELSKGAVPELFNRFRQSILRAKAQALALGKSFAVGSVTINQGEWDYRDETSTSYADYLARLIQLILDIRALIVELTGQTTLVPIYLFQTGGQYTKDAKELAVGRAQIAATQALPGVYLVGGNQVVPDKGGHTTGQGYAWLGNQLGKVMQRTIIEGLNFECTRALRWTHRGTTLCGLFHTAQGPLRFLAPYLRLVPAPAYSAANRGLFAQDDAGILIISNVRLSGQLVFADLNRPVSGTLKVWLGRASAVNGAVCIADSDSTPLLQDYVYTAGSGQQVEENIPDLVGLRFGAENFALADVLTATAS